VLNRHSIIKSAGGISDLVNIESSSDTELQAVIFDCDGVLVDSEPLHYKAFQAVLVPLGLGHDFQSYLDRFVGFDDRDAFIHAFKEAGRELAPDTLERLMEAKAVALEDFIRQGVPSFPGVVELVKELKGRGIPMAVASGALRHEIEAFIASLGLNGAFRVIVAADEVKKSKPDPETYILAMQRLRQTRGSKLLAPENCVAIEDTRAGILSAKLAGLVVIAVTNSFSATELAEADEVIGSLSELSFPKIVKLLERRRQAQK
jgi:beta-phosphoglucomutase